MEQDYPNRPSDGGAISDRQSNQNFSYYGRRFLAAAEKVQMSPEPGALDITAEVIVQNAAPKIGRGNAPTL